MRKIVAAAAVLLMAACSRGGGDVREDSSASSRVGQPRSCSTPIVQLFGDSTQFGQGDNLQRYMDNRFGKGKVIVHNFGVNGTVAQDMGKARFLRGAVTVSNYGINDLDRRVDLDSFKAALRVNRTTFYQTPNPPLDGYATAVREVAAELKRPVIDVSAWVRAQPGWEAHVPDRVHPDAWLYQQITTQLVGPAIGDAVASSVCR